MKTSPTQFLVIVDFMERNGDLNKPAEGPYGRHSQQKNWAELGEVLNMDITGEAKPVEKWKRVWSDLKNNTKKKAAKIHRAVSGTGGGPPSTLVLSDLELRILGITGSRAATGLTNIEEVGAPPARPVPAPVRSPTLPTEPTPVPYMLHVETSPSTSLFPAHTSPPPNHTSPPPDHRSPPPPPPTHTCPASASRRRDFRPRSASRRSAPRTRRVDDATRQFEANEERWRYLFKELATEHLQLRRDDQQLRRQQLQVQAQWQALFARSIDLAENFMISLVKK